jgi:hypothetical protein
MQRTADAAGDGRRVPPAPLEIGSRAAELQEETAKQCFSVSLDPTKSAG